MKAIAVKFLIMATATVAFAVVIRPFTDWRTLTDGSSDILILRCTRTPDPVGTSHNGIMREIRDGIVDSEVRPVFMLKGTGASQVSVLSSQYWPRQGEDYLVFGMVHNGSCQAIEPYRVVPLGISFSTNVVAGKTLNERIRAVLEYRLEAVNRQLREAQEEKERLTQGLKE
jgi:hypothetical protein